MTGVWDSAKKYPVIPEKIDLYLTLPLRGEDIILLVKKSKEVFLWRNNVSVLGI